MDTRYTGSGCRAQHKSAAAVARQADMNYCSLSDQITENTAAGGTLAQSKSCADTRARGGGAGIYTRCVELGLMQHTEKMERMSNQLSWQLREPEPGQKRLLMECRS